MVRLDKPTAIQILITLLYAKEMFLYVRGRDYVRRNYSTGFGNGVNQTYRDIFYQYFVRDEEADLSDLNWDTLIEPLVKQIQYYGKGDHGTLIDLMANLLQKPFSRNVIAGSTLQTLRDALLLPNEVSALVTKIDAQEICCAGCGRRINNGVAVSLVQKGGTDGLAVYCLLCNTPQHVSCAGCNEVVRLKKSQIKGLRQKVTCDKCSAKPEEKSGEAQDEAGVVTPAWDVQPASGADVQPQMYRQYVGGALRADPAINPNAGDVPRFGETDVPAPPPPTGYRTYEDLRANTVEGLRVDPDNATLEYGILTNNLRAIPEQFLGELDLPAGIDTFDLQGQGDE